MTARPCLVWTPTMKERLRALWGEGHSGTEIGKRMGMTKSSVIGAAHRMGLPPRASPIRSLPDGERPKRIRTRKLRGKQTLTVLGSPSQTALTAPKVASTQIVQPVQIEPTPVILMRRDTCQWIEGHPGRGRPYTFCAKPCCGSWCEEHYRRVFVVQRAQSDAVNPEHRRAA